MQGLKLNYVSKRGYWTSFIVIVFNNQVSVDHIFNGMITFINVLYKQYYEHTPYVHDIIQYA